MKTKEIREKRIEDLKKMLLELTKKMQELNFKNANNQLKNIRELRDTKKSIAKIETILKERINEPKLTDEKPSSEDK